MYLNEVMLTCLVHKHTCPFKLGCVGVVGVRYRAAAVFSFTADGGKIILLSHATIYLQQWSKNKQW